MHSCGACVAMSIWREFICCHEVVTKYLGLIMLVSLVFIAVNLFQLVSILHTGREKFVQGCKQAVTLTTYTTTASDNTASWMVKTWLYKGSISHLSTTKNC